MTEFHEGGAAPGAAVGHSGTGHTTATFGGGCFWCLEAVFLQLRGVISVQSGYAGGRRPNPTYEEVCAGDTGHAEVVRVTFDPSVISFDDLLDVFFTIHDPTTLNRQGADTGTQYRSAVFYESLEQEQQVRHKIRELAGERTWPDPIVTEVALLTHFWPAESYHDNYFARNQQNPYCAAVIAPKVAKARKYFFDKLAR